MGPDGRLTDAELWARASGHDGDAFGELFDRHATRVYNHCFKRTADWTAAEDLTSVVFLEAWRKRRQVHLTGDSILPWLLAVANNCLRNTQRARRRYRRLLATLPRTQDAPSFEPEATDRLDDVVAMRRIIEVLAQLSPEDQEIVSLCDLSGLTYDEAASALGLPVGTVKSRLSRARTPAGVRRPRGVARGGSSRAGRVVDVNANGLSIPPDRAFPAERHSAARSQLQRVASKRSRPDFARWRLGALLGLGVGLSVGGGVALASGVFSSEPGAPVQTQLSRTVTATHVGTATVELGRAPHGANSVSFTLTGLSVGSYAFPNGSALGCAQADLQRRPDGCQMMDVQALSPGEHTITVTTTARAMWRLEATYVNEVVTPWKVNALGETYGVANGHGFPDLVAVVFDNGRRTGYAKWKDLNCMNGLPSTPAEALGQQKQMQRTNIAIPVYESNGTTRIGVFIQGQQGPGMHTVPLSSVRCTGPPVPQNQPITGLPGG